MMWVAAPQCSAPRGAPPQVQWTWVVQVIVCGGTRQGLAAEQHTTSACDVGEGRPPSPPSCDSSLAPATPGSLDQATASAVTRAGMAGTPHLCRRPRLCAALQLIPASRLHPLYFHRLCPWHLGRGAARRTALGSCHIRHPPCPWLRRGRAARHAHLRSRHLYLDLLTLYQQMEAVGASEGVLHLHRRWRRHRRGRRGSPALAPQLVAAIALQFAIGRCAQ